MPYALFFILIGLTWLILAVQVGSSAVRAVLACLAFSFLAVGAAYLAASPRVFMKNAAGRRHPASRAFLWPFDLLNVAVFNLYHRLRRRPAYVEVLPGLFLGRRLWGHEVDALGPCGVLDLTCEFSENRPMRDGRRYRCLPVLDNTCPTPAQLEEGVAWLADSLPQGRVYVHCAAGHGRSATVVLAYLLTIGKVRGIDEGIAFLKSLRPGVHLNRCQRKALTVFLRTRGGGSWGHPAPS